MDGDEVDSISATPEAEAIAGIVKENFFNIVGIADLPEHYDLYELDATSIVTPTIMTLPSNVITLDWVKYNNKLTADTGNNFVEVAYLTLNEFLRMQESLSVDTSNVSSQTYTVNSATINLKYITDKMPQFYTTWDNLHLLFDSINTGEDANLQKNKTECYGLLAPSFTLSDSHVPDLDSRQFQLLLNESKSQAFLELRQTANPKAEKRAKDNWINNQRTKQGVPNPYPEYTKVPGYGRKGPKTSSMISAMKRGS